jgi:hypothetical protein
MRAYAAGALSVIGDPESDRSALSVRHFGMARERRIQIGGGNAERADLRRVNERGVIARYLVACVVRSRASTSGVGTSAMSCQRARESSR